MSEHGGHMPQDTPQTRPTICLTMIVRDEAHIVCEALDSAAPHIDRWLVVDTGSTDDTIAVVERRMAEHGIPGRVHRRPWQDFGTNRTEAMRLAADQADYLWVLDADDLVTGTLDLTTLRADSYLMRYRVGHAFWRRQLFRASLPWRYEGVLHEYPVCDAPATEERLAGEYEIHGRTLGARSTDPLKYARDAALLRAEVARDPDDLRSLFYLGQSLADAGEDAEAAEVFAQRAAAGGWDEERCHALMRRAECLQRLGLPWAQALDAYLEAFQARPTRAEPFARIARHYREAGAFSLGHHFAGQAAAMPYPEADNLFVDDAVYAWGAKDEQAVCAYHLGRYAEALDLGTRLLAGTALPDEQRERVAGNRESCIAPVLQERTQRPAPVVDRLVARSGPGPWAGGDVTVTLAALGDGEALERTLNSFLHCCEDVDRVARFVCVTDGLAPSRVRGLLGRHPYLETVRAPAGALAATGRLDRLLGMVHTPLWLHLEAGWELFSRSPIVDRAARILHDDPRIAQVALNRASATSPAGRDGAGGTVRAAGAVRYRLYDHVEPVTLQPSVVDVERLRTAGPLASDAGERYVAAGLRTASFDEVTAVRADAAQAPEPSQIAVPPIEAAGSALDAPDAGAPAMAAPLLSSLVAQVRVGELAGDVEPPWPVVSAAVAAADDGARITVRTAILDAEPIDHELLLGPGLEAGPTRPLPVGPQPAGPLEIDWADARLRLDRADDGAMRLTCLREGTPAGVSPPFSLAGADEEHPFGLCDLGGRLLVVFGVHRERLALAVIEGHDVHALLGGDGHRPSTAPSARDTG